MAWRVTLHPDVSDDFTLMGTTEARTILKVIHDRIQNGEPDKLGKPLTGALAGCRRIRTGNTRIAYRINAKTIEILIVAVGWRRNSAVYATAGKRV